MHYMNKPFWKIIAVAFLVILLFWVWTQNIVIIETKTALIKINKLTGKVKVTQPVQGKLVFR